MQMFSRTQLTTAIHKRLFTRFFSERGKRSVHRLGICTLFKAPPWSFSMNCLAPPGDFASFPKKLTNARQLPNRGMSKLAIDLVMVSTSS